jgi:hypothetical protein
MKLILMLLVLGALACVGVYFLGGVQGWDPSEQGRAARQKITPGTTWKQVLDIAGEPRKYRQVNRHVEKLGGEEIEVFRLSPRVKFDRARVAERIGNGDFPYGFVFEYEFSKSVAYGVTFDDTGIVKETYDLATEADLYQWPED